MGSKSEIHFKNASNGENVTLELEGDWLDKSAEIKYNGQVVASISRKFFNAREFFGDKQTVRTPAESGKPPPPRDRDGGGPRHCHCYRGDDLRFGGCWARHRPCGALWCQVGRSLARFVRGRTGTLCCTCSQLGRL